MGVVIYQPVHGRVEVRPGHDGHVQFVRERVVSIQHDEQREGQPADGEHEVNDEESTRQLQRGIDIPASRVGFFLRLHFFFPVVQTLKLLPCCSVIAIGV